MSISNHSQTKLLPTLFTDILSLVSRVGSAVTCYFDTWQLPFLPSTCLRNLTGSLKASAHCVLIIRNPICQKEYAYSEQNMGGGVSCIRCSLFSVEWLSRSRTLRILWVCLRHPLTFRHAANVCEKTTMLGSWSSLIDHIHTAAIVLWRHAMDVKMLSCCASVFEVARHTKVWNLTNSYHCTASWLIINWNDNE